MSTRLSPKAAPSPQALEQLERKTIERVRKDCPDIEWIGSYAILGPYEYLNVFRAKDVEPASNVSTLIRTFGHAQTEIWTATEWDRFKEIVRNLRKHDATKRERVPLGAKYALSAPPSGRSICGRSNLRSIGVSRLHA